MIILIFFFLHWYISLFFQTFFHHRYSAHSMFSMSKAWERIFYFMSFVAQGSSYLSPRTYGILHRLHHAYADTEQDPHSPKYDKNLLTMMWRTKQTYSRILKDESHIEEKFRKDLPDWKSLDHFADKWAVRIGWGVFYSLFYIIFATEWWMFLLLPMHYVMGPLHGAIINWFAHKYGYVNFKVKDTSKNLMPVDILMLGEGFHNNHHKFGGRPNFGFRWFEIDPVYPVIRAFNWLKIIQLKRAST